MKKITFVYENIVIGGVQTLLIRLSKALIKIGVNVEIYYSRIYERGELEFEEIGTNMYSYTRQYPYDIIESNKNSNIITFEVGTYMDMVVANKKSSNTSIFLYSVHPYTFEYFYKSCKYSIFYKIFHNQYYKFVKRTVENGGVMFMDEQCFNHTCTEYDINNIDDIDKYLLRVIMPVDDVEFNMDIHNNLFNILTVSRADFPFKGYIKGLINCFKELQMSGKKLKLTIITSGTEKEQVYKWCENQENIEIIEDVSYEKLKKYYREANVYVGMGTTILEAAASGVVAIPIAPYTYECNTYGLFSEKPNWILTEIGEGKNIKNNLEYLMGLSDSDYEKLSILSKKSVQKLYGEEIVINKFKDIISCSIKDKGAQYKYLPFGFILFIKIKKVVKNLVERVRKVGKNA